MFKIFGNRQRGWIDYHFLLTYYLLVLAVFLIPFSLIITRYIIALFLISWFFERQAGEKIQMMRANRFIILIIIFYALHLVSFLYSSNVDSSLKDLETKLTLVFFPLALGTSNNIIRSRVNRVLLAFVLGCLVVLLLDSSIFIYDLTKQEKVYNWFSKYPVIALYKFFPHFLHPSYYTMYLVMSIAVLYYFIHHSLPSKKVIRVSYVLLPLFTIGVFIIGSRTGYISVVLVHLISFFVIFKKLWIKIILTFSLIIISIFVFNNNRLRPYITYIEKSFSDKIEYSKEELIEGRVARFIFWKASFEVIADDYNYLVGVGNGDNKDELMKQYKEMNVLDSFGNVYNSHNQFLSTFISLGIPGGINLILLLLIPFVYFLKRGNYLSIMFILLIFIHFLPETILGRLEGVLFFSLFYGLLISLNATKYSLKKRSF